MESKLESGKGGIGKEFQYFEQQIECRGLR